jgi:solute carrier family 12 (potassium/chloride transporter), member 4/6
VIPFLAFAAVPREEMENGGIEEADDALPVPAPPNGRRYRPVESSGRAVVQMASLEPGSSSSSGIAATVTAQPPR